MWNVERLCAFRYFKVVLTKKHFQSQTFLHFMLAGVFLTRACMLYCTVVLLFVYRAFGKIENQNFVPRQFFNLAGYLLHTVYYIQARHRSSD